LPTTDSSVTSSEVSMALVLVLLLLALLLGGVGLFVEGLKWLLVIAVILFVLSFFTGYRGRRTV
jgi:hypothetical membrane protein